MIPALNGSTALQCFERGNAVNNKQQNNVRFLPGTATYVFQSDFKPLTKTRPTSLKLDDQFINWWPIYKLDKFAISSQHTYVPASFSGSPLLSRESGYACTWTRLAWEEVSDSCGKLLNVIVDVCILAD